MPQVLMSQNQNAPDAFPLARTLAPPAGVSEQATADMTWALAKLARKRLACQLYKQYYVGEHRLTYATRAYREAFAALVQNLRANLCPAVITALTDKLEVTGFEPHDAQHRDTADRNASTPEERVALAAWSLWQDQSLTLIADQIHDEAAICGDAFLVIWPDADGTARVHPQDATEMVARYNMERKAQLDVAAKVWREGKRWRLTLYYADRLEKYRSRAANAEAALPSSAQAFEPYQPDGDEAWPLPNPYGQVPVFHFPFSGPLGGDGLSDLADVIPLQDGLNKALADELVAREFAAYAQRWATGIEPEITIDANTGEAQEQELPFKIGIDRIIHTANENARFGQFSATDLEKFVAVIDAYFGIVGRIKGIPRHYFFMSGDFPSGEAQRTAEERLVKRARKLQRRFGAVWQAAMTFALQVAGVGDGALRITTVWASAEPRAVNDEIKNFKTAVDGGLAVKTALRELLRWNDEQIDQAEIDRDAEAQQTVERAQTSFTRMLDRGTGVDEAAPLASRQAAG